MDFVDIQVNGAFGIDFNDDDLRLEDFQRVCEKLAATGVKHLFPTLITAPIDQMLFRIRTISKWVSDSPQLSELIPGLHIEGPFISALPGYRGTHELASIQDATPDVMSRILDAGNGLIKLVTLAPERDAGFQVTSMLADRGIVVFGGHSDCSLDELRGAIDHGLQGFTHLGNGCALDIARHDNILNRVLSLGDRLTVSIIADAVHVPLWLLKHWANILPPGNVIVTSDSMSAAGMPPGEYWICGQPILVDEDRRTRHRDHNYLAGSASTMLDMSKIAPLWLGEDRQLQSKYFSENASNLFHL